MTPHDALALAEAEARYQRERYDLYRAKVYSGRPTSDRRLRELERLAGAAQLRLDAARAADAASRQAAGDDGAG